MISSTLWEDVKRLLLDAEYDTDIIDSIQRAQADKSTADQLDALKQLIGVIVMSVHARPWLLVFQFSNPALKGCID